MKDLKNKIFISLFSLNKAETRDQYKLSRFLSLNKINKISKFRFDIDYNRSLYAELLVLMSLNKNFGLKVNSINILYNDAGKPYIKNYQNLNLSIAHSGSYVTVATSLFAVGIDIEVKSKINFQIISDRYFTEEEQSYIKSRTDFYKVWTAKESYIKLRGVCLKDGLRYFSLRENGKNRFIVKKNNLLTQYYIRCFENYKNHILSVCSEQGMFYEFKNVGQTDILNFFFEKKRGIKC